MNNAPVRQVPGSDVRSSSVEALGRALCVVPTVPCRPLQDRHCQATTESFAAPEAVTRFAKTELTSSVGGAQTGARPDDCIGIRDGASMLGEFEGVKLAAPRLLCAAMVDAPVAR